MNKDVYKQIYKLIKAYDEIVIARHISPDPDAVGSQIAMRDSIKLTFPNKKVYAVGNGVSKFKYFGTLDKLDPNSITKGLLIVLDVPNFSRVDGIEGLTYEKIIKIDHHPKEDIVGDADFTSSDYSSVAEMVAELFFNTRLQMDKKIAENLFLGIVSDSERFLFRNTGINTFEVALKLIKKYNLDFVSLYDNLYFKTLNECRFEAYIYNNLIVTENKFGYILLDNSKLEECGVDSSAPAVIVNHFNFIEDLIAWCFITYNEKNELYKANIRSRGPVINVVASRFNGGGHNYASGARFTQKEYVDELIKALDNACKEYLEKEKHED